MDSTYGIRKFISDSADVEYIAGNATVARLFSGRIMRAGSPSLGSNARRLDAAEPRIS
jgi:hypothetical protein